MNWKQNDFSFFLIFVLILILMLLCFLFSYLLVTLGLDSNSSTIFGQMLFIFIIFILGAATSMRKDEEDSQTDIEAATENAIDFTEMDPPAYDDVLEKEEMTCPSYDQAVKINQW